MRALAIAALLLGLVVPALAQDPAALAAREQALAQKAATGLRSIAKALATTQRHARALELWQEIWQRYAEDDAEARDKCGFVKVGDTWRRDLNKLVMDQDGKGKADAKVLKKAEQEFAALAKELVAEHRALAKDWTAANDPRAAERHWQRVLRFLPADAEAASAMALQQFEGFRGTPRELGMLRRARAIRGACSWLVRAQLPVSMRDGEHHELLAAAKVAHQGARSAHFTVWGMLPPAELQLIAQDCERALLLSLMLMGTSTGEVFVPARRRDIAFLDDAAYEAVLDRCADQFDAQRLQFLKKDVDLAYVEHGGVSLRIVKSRHGLEASRDQAVRGVVQDALGALTNGLWEGIGHAACGFLFGRTLTFMTEQQSGQTVSTWKPRALVPDLAVWMKIAEESAWAKSDTRTSELVLLSAARFTTEQRVKAWGICHYLMHWRPELLQVLDSSQTKDIHTPPAVEAEFQRRTQLDLVRIDADWRAFWGDGAELRRQMAIDPVPPEAGAGLGPATAADKAKAGERATRVRARSVVDAVDAARAAAVRGPVGFYVADREDVVATAGYEAQVAKVEAERKKRPKETLPLPPLPAAVGTTVLRSLAADANAAVAGWLQRPVWRDALLHPGRDLLGAPLGGTAWVLDLAMPPQPAKAGLPWHWPGHGQPAVPGSVVVGELGPRATAALVAAGKAATDTVGPAITLHFARNIDPGELAQLRCRAFVGNLAREGVLVVYDGKAEEGDHAAGCVAFVPLEPMPSGSKVEVQWELTPGLAPKPKDGKDTRSAREAQRQLPAVSFTVQ